MTSLCIDGLDFSYDRRRVLGGLSLESTGAEFLAVVGPNGSGKTTLFRCITGFLEPTAGRITVCGKDLARSDRREMARTIAVVPQKSTGHFGFSCMDIVSMGRTAHVDWLSGEGGRDRQAVELAMRDAGVLGLRGRLFSRISGGEQQRVIIARALAQEPRVLLLDEPTAHLDIAGQVEIMSLVRGLVERKGLLAVAAIHDINLASRFCDRVALLYGGRIRAIGTPAEVVTESNIMSTFGVGGRVLTDGGTGLPYLLPDVAGTRADQGEANR